MEQAFYATMLTLAKAGDEVILPTPWYFNAEYVPPLLPLP